MIETVLDLDAKRPAGPTPLPAAWECDLADDSLHWSPGVFDLFGLPRDAPVKRSEVVRQYTPESRAELERLRRDAIATCGSFTFEAEIRRSDGSPCWMRISADVVTRNGRATRLYGCKQDITEEMLARRDG
jgi:PAS domain S-box-containing protein